MTDERAPDSAPEGHGPGLDFGVTPPTKSAAASVYRVLARKYRPSSFDDLIGQEAMVRTLTNAFELDRIHQAYLLTGVRGVGKTTTARILARAFNYELPARDGHEAINRPTIRMVEPGVHCQAIMDSRHVDVIEMDAASHTGVDDVREIIENARYRPVMARMKVYIIDEVHMLSKPAFNALLKTLEEPPDHVKFLLATTEIDKVPITVRSRCQRFDLRRIEPDVMARHLSSICDREQVRIETDAMALVVRAAEGSVRDALSLLDQAIAHGISQGDGTIRADELRHMLGVADRARLIDLFELVMKGDIAASLALLADQYNQGADPASVLTDLAEFVHFVTGIKLAPQVVAQGGATPEEIERGTAFAKALNVPVLTRAWQILSRGIEDVRSSPRPLAAADMVLVRLAYAADLPTPDEALRRLGSQPASAGSMPPAGAQTASRATSPGPAPQASRNGPSLAASNASPAPAMSPVMAAPAAVPRVRLSSLADLVTLAQVHRDIQIKTALERDVRPVRFEPGLLEFAPMPGASPQLAQTLMRKLQDWTGERWMVAVSSQPGASTLREIADARDQERMTGVRADPLVRSVLEQFPGAEIVAVRTPDAAPLAESPLIAVAAESDDVVWINDSDSDDDFPGQDS